MLGRNEVLIINCQFASNTYFNHLFLFSSKSYASVQFVNCKFINNGILDLVNSKLIMLYESINVELNNCEFYDSIEMVIEAMGKDTNPSNVIIKNTNYSTTKTFIHFTKFCFSFISLSHTTLTLVDSVNFYNISDFDSIICLRGNSTISISGTVKFSYNYVVALINLHENNIHSQYIIIKVTIK